MERFKCVKGLPSLLNENHYELGQLFTFIFIHRQCFAGNAAVIISGELLGIVWNKLLGSVAYEM